MSSTSDRSRRGIGIAPLVAGLLLVGRTAGDVAGGDPWAVSGFVGGCAAVAVGAGVLRGWRGFDPGTNDDVDGRITRALAVVALVGFAVGVASVVV